MNQSVVALSSTTLATTTTAIPVLQSYLNTFTSLTLPTFCWCLTIFVISFLLLSYRYAPHLLLTKKGGLSTPMLILLTNHLVNNAIFLLSQYGVNNVVNIDRDVINASGWLNTWWSFWVGNYLMAGPCSVFFVVMDRFLALKMSFKYTKEVQLQLRIAAFVTMALLYTFSFCDVMIAWPYANFCNEPGTEENPIANRACLPLLNRIVNFTQQTIKVTFATLNLVISSFFLYLLMKAKVANLRDGIVRITILFEFVFDVIPAFLSLFFSGAQIVINLNVYLFLMSSLDAAMCSLCYAKLLFNFGIFTHKQTDITQVSSRVTVSAVQIGMTPRASIRTIG